MKNADSLQTSTQTNQQGDFPTEARLCSPQRAAQLLEISRRTIYTLMERGDLPSVKIGSLRRIPVAGIIAYIEKRADERIPAEVP